MELVDLTRWPTDGEGHIEAQRDGGWRIDVGSPFTLWYPQALPDNVEIGFECNVFTPNSAMLLIACAHRWRGGGDLLAQQRSGAYSDYAYGDLEMYTIGFNRAVHVRSDVQPNASTANVRRIGGARGEAFRGLDLQDRGDEMMRLWHAWDQASLLCSVREPSAGCAVWYAYTARLAAGRITLEVDGQPLLSVVDHYPDPLLGGYFALRNMTPGASFGVRNLRVRVL